MQRLLAKGRFGSYPTDLKWRKANLLVRKMLWTLHEVSGFNHAAARKAEKAVRKLSRLITASLGWPSAAEMRQRALPVNYPNGVSHKKRTT